MSYSCLNDHSAFCQFYSNLKLLQNSLVIIKDNLWKEFQGHTISGLSCRYE